MKTEIQIDLFGELESFYIEFDYAYANDFEDIRVYEIRDESESLIDFDDISSSDLDIIRKEIYNQEHAYYE